MSHLFSPLTIRGLTLRNRTVVSPMCQYSAIDGMANDWHLVHLGRFGMGGFGLVIVEATGVTPEGRISYADLGLWQDEQIAPLRRVTDFLHTQGAAAGIQIAHAGRKASTQPPFRPEVPESAAARDAVGYQDWEPVAPSAVPHAEGHKLPHELSTDEIAGLVQAFADAARRAEAAGFDVVEIHGAHGYLISEFMSPLANSRTDAYGGSRENRMRFPLEVAKAVRAVWPEDKPLFMRISAQDWHPEGWQVEDSVALAKELKSAGVDVIDCSSGGFAGVRIEPGPLYQVPLAAAVRKGADMATMAVGFITGPEQAEAILEKGEADLVAMARPALDDPNWPVHAAELLDPETHMDLWPQQEGWAIRGLRKILPVPGNEPLRR